MKSEQIQANLEIAAEIGNFEDCYSDIQLSSSDGIITSSVLIEWLTENPHMAEIALRISKIHRLTFHCV